MTARARILIVALIAAASAGACATPGGASPEVRGTYPEICPRLDVSPRRCAAVVAKAGEDAKVDASQVMGIELTRPARPAGQLGGGQHTIVRFLLPGDQVVEAEVVCVGIMGAFDVACGDEASISFIAGVDRDLPCSGEPPAGCATLPPTPPPDLVGIADDFERATLDIVIDHPGPYAVPLGRASLPNGYLSERTVDIVDVQPKTFWITAGVLQVVSDVEGRPDIGSVYRDPYDGLEPVSITLEFTVFEYISPGLLQLRNIVVR